MKLNRCNEWMFQIVKCKGYLKTAPRDGQWFELLGGSTYLRPQVCIIHSNDERDGQECEGGAEIIKTRYIHADKEFIGVVVGMSMVATKELIYADWEEDGYSPDGFWIKKQPEEQVKCAKVYYGCNKSRWVPLDDMEVLDESVGA